MPQLKIRASHARLLVNYCSVITSENFPGEDDVLNAGDVIEYSMEVSNTGNTCLQEVNITDNGMATVTCGVAYTGR